MNKLASGLRGPLTKLVRLATITPLLAAILALALPAHAATSDFTASYKGGSSSCGTTYQIKGKEPADQNKHPVFIYMVGTSDTYDNAQAMTAVQGMADRGYVAATIEYPNAAMGFCNTLTARSKCIFDQSSAQSAVAALCSREHADCGKGMVVGGFSQGALLSILAKNFDNRVEAVYATGAHKNYIIYNVNACVGNGKRVLPSSRLRVVNGENDLYGGGTQAGVRSSSEALTGYQCNGTSCLQGNGSGWRMVLKSEVQDGSADHCYIRANSCLSNQNNLDPGWATGTAEWTLNGNLDWLTQFTAR
ncbi:hypothetical protein [Aquabacterium sp. NJ1]|uniref:hypothetical protein n=1 Tax=Aquabacterium sp. NJ1 TaxID=1538295 RepID=UPI00126A0B5E|nr:hypothetical protein [Aquabacterium sp. NJ1]